ncbi:ABC transporter [Paraphaeosphaeria sporulosa]
MLPVVTEKKSVGSLFNARQCRKASSVAQTEPSITDADSSKELVFDTGKVRFQNVEFAYDPRKPLITDLNFVAEPGKTVAIVGTTGSGKSTLLKLLFRLYDPCEGSITIDGQDIRHVRLSSLRSAIGIVPQNPTLFNGTIRENIRYARLDATDEQIIDRLRPPLTMTSLCPSSEADLAELDRMLDLWAKQAKRGTPMTKDENLEIFGGRKGELKNLLRQFIDVFERKEGTESG